MTNRPDNLDDRQPLPHPDSWQWNRVIEWLTAGCLAAAIGYGAFSYIGVMHLAVPYPLFRMPTTYLAPGFAAFGVALSIWWVRRRKRAE